MEDRCVIYVMKMCKLEGDCTEEDMNIMVLHWNGRRKKLTDVRSSELLDVASNRTFVGIVLSLKSSEPPAAYLSELFVYFFYTQDSPAR